MTFSFTPAELQLMYLKGAVVHLLSISEGFLSAGLELNTCVSWVLAATSAPRWHR